MITLSAGAYVQKVAFKLNTAFDGSGAGSQLQIEVGDGVDADGYIEASRDSCRFNRSYPYAAQDGAYFNEVYAIQ